MSSMHEERSQPIVETSLTELAFIFFFILLIFSAWKFSELNTLLDEKNDTHTALEQQIDELKSSLQEASKLVGLDESVDPEALFKELSVAKAQAERASTLTDENRALEEKLNQLTELMDNITQSSTNSPEQLLNKLGELSSLTNAIQQAGEVAGIEEETAEELLGELIQQHKDAKGQNINLRQKVAQLGNGLDHPPCWADPVTGNIQYVFDVVINESSVDFHPGWPESRHAQAINNPNILLIPGVYERNKELWISSKALYKESVAAKCRHFVKVYDHAESKRAFKSYLLGIENHFYKFLSTTQYE